MSMELVINSVAEAINTTERQLKDGFQVTDLFGFVTVFAKIPEVIASKEQIASDWKNRTPEQLAAWVAQAKEKIDIANESLERKIEKGLASAASIIDFVGEFHHSEPAQPEA